MNQNTTDRVHLINQETLELKKLNPESLQQFLKTTGISQMGKKYNVVSIIGSQSTGKSTLLNKMFGTQFDVQQRSHGLGQTTVGIWLSRDKTEHILVLDVEGSDSVERKTSDNMVENQTALFALAMSHAFIINVFLNMNLKLFQQDTVKSIVFVIRDWEEEASYEDAQARVHKYMTDIWNDIPKPESMQNVAFSQLFRIEVFTLCYFKMKEFTQETQQLRNKLIDSNDKQFLFNGFDYERNLPVDGLPFYLSNIWETIANNKDLNLPNEKILVSNLRCQQIKVDCIEMIKNDVQEMQDQVNKGLYEQFGERGRQVLQSAVSKFQVEAHDYVKEVFVEKQVELENEVISKLFQLFQKQVDQIKKFILDDFHCLLQQLKQIATLSDLPDQLKQIKQQIPETFQEMLHKSIIKEGAWNEDDLVESFNQQIRLQIQQFVENQITIYQQRLDKVVKGEVEKIVGQQITDIGMNFWTLIQQQFDELFQTKYQKFEQILTKLEVNDDVKEKYLSGFTKDCYEDLENDIKHQSTRFREALFYKFKQYFLRDDNGQPRDWKKMTEEQILHLYNETKDRIFKLLEMLRFHQLKASSFTQLNARKQIQSSIFRKPLIVEDRNQSQLDLDNVVLSEVAYNQIKNALLEEFDIQYQDALQKHVYQQYARIFIISQKQDFLQNIPKWFWFLLLFFMYDDLLRWLGNPLFLYPILMIICFVGFCIAIGYHNLPKILFQQVIRQFNVILGPLLFGGLAKLKSS